MSWSKEKSLGTIREVGLVPIVRAPSAEDAMLAAEAIVAGNIGILEITMTVPNAIQVMEKVADKFGDKVLLGAGTILDPETCRAALLAGAQFIVTPSLNLQVIELARRYSKPCIPGALTPDGNRYGLASGRGPGENLPVWTGGRRQVHQGAQGALSANRVCAHGRGESGDDPGIHQGGSRRRGGGQRTGGPQGAEGKRKRANARLRGSPQLSCLKFELCARRC